MSRGRATGKLGTLAVALAAAALAGSAGAAGAAVTPATTVPVAGAPAPGLSTNTAASIGGAAAGASSPAASKKTPALSTLVDGIPITYPSRAGGATIARIVTTTQARPSPGSGPGVLGIGPSTSFSHEPQMLLVLGSVVRSGVPYLRVLLPIRPDGTSGWIPRSKVVLSHDPYWITVQQSTKQVLVYDQGQLVHDYRAVIGRPSTPTPIGLAAIWEKDRQVPSDFEGTWELPLTILSKTLRSFGGGPGRVAIHGRGGASLLNPLGTAASHGCIRIDNGPIEWLARNVPAGTPVDILHV
jgi:lipoprotein-anchoring transpeptidase ErfK/SrfK